MSDRLRDSYPLPLVQAVIGLWSRRTFPDNTPRGITNHFQEEAEELVKAVKSEPIQKVGEEIADVLMLTLVLADKLGIDAYAEVERKFAEIKDARFVMGPNGYHKRVK